MNGKFIILFFLCINIVGLGFAFSCTQETAQCDQTFRPTIINFFFNLDTDKDFTAKGGPAINQEFGDAVEDMTQPESSGVFSEVTGFLVDGLKMLVGVLSLLTPVPMLDFISGLGMPIWVTMFIAPPLFILWILAIAEFIRGAAL